jgi:hypothetical protein
MPLALNAAPDRRQSGLSHKRLVTSVTVARAGRTTVLCLNSGKASKSRLKLSAEPEG